jgi:hypothetical protein
MHQQSCPGNLVRAIVAGPSGGGPACASTTSVLLVVCSSSLSGAFLLVGLFVGSFVHMRVPFLPCLNSSRSVPYLFSALQFSTLFCLHAAAAEHDNRLLSTGLSWRRGG